MTSTRSFSIAILLASFIIAGSIWTQPATATKPLSVAQGDIGVVDIYHLVDILIMSDESSQQRAQYEIEGNTAITAYEQQLLGIQTQMAAIEQSDPKAAELYNQYQQVSQAIQQTTNQINAGYQQLLATQIANAYKEIYAATNQVAADQSYTFVLATRRGSDLLQTTTLTGVTQEILARPLVTPPEATDLTDSIRAHMGLPTMEEITAQIKAEQEAAQAAADAASLKAEFELKEATRREAESNEAAPTPAIEITDDE